MGIINNLSAALQAATDWTFSDAVLLSEGAATVNDTGAVVHASVETACRAKVDKKETRDSSGGLVRKTRILILAGSLTVEPQRGNKISGLDRAYKLGKCDRDGINSHWVCEVDDG